MLIIIIIYALILFLAWWYLLKSYNEESVYRLVEKNFGILKKRRDVEVLQLSSNLLAYATILSNPQKAEYLIPIFIGELLEQGKMSVKVLKTNDTWYGMTYHEDVAAVKDSFKKMLEKGVYKADLFSDL